MWQMVPPWKRRLPFCKQSDSRAQRLGSTFRRIRSLHIIRAVEIFGGLFAELYLYPDIFMSGIELDFSLS